MSPLRILATASALPIAQLVVGGFGIGPGLGALPALATLLAVALLLRGLHTATAGLRRLLVAALPWPTLRVVASLLFNGVLCWTAMAAAGAMGLAVSVAGYLPALCASLVIPLVAGLLLTAVSALRPA